MGYFKCQYCKAYLPESILKDLLICENNKSIGYSFTCPMCLKENHKKILN